MKTENKMKTRVNWEQLGLMHIPLDCTSKCEMYLAMTEMGIDIIGGDVVPFLSAYLSFVLLKHSPIYFYHLTLRCSAPYETCVDGKTST